MITRAEALAWLLPGTCGSCAAALPGPGEPCGICGRIPEVTSAELAGDLDGPVALAAVEAAKLRAGAWGKFDEALAGMREADRALFLARAQVRRDQAQQALDQHHRQHKSLYGPRTAARKAEERAAAELAEASAQHAGIAYEEEISRRMRHGVAAETDAALKLDKATAVLRRYQDELAKATAARQAAEQAVDESAARAAVLEAARDEAVAAHSDPGHFPVSAETVTMGGLRLVLRGGLDEVELLIAGEVARLVCAATGVTADIEAEVRRQLLAEQEAEKRDKPLHLAPLGNGNVVAAPNPQAPGTPMPFDPPTHGRGNGAYQPPATARLGQ